MDADLNYFVSTLGQAAELNATNPHKFKTVNDFLALQARDYPDEPAVGFPLPITGGIDRPWDHEVLTFSDLFRGSNILAELVKGDIGELHTDGDRQQTIALLCPSSPLFLFAWLGLMRLGYSVLLIAPQCQPSAIVHLCKSCQVDVLFYDHIYEQLANEAKSNTDSSLNLQAVLLPFTGSADDLFDFVKTEHTEEIEIEVVREVTEHDIAYLHHTSGTSTGLPKPIGQTHRAGVGVLPCFPNGSRKASFTTTPLYHGGVADCFRAWTSTAMIWLFPGKEIPITASNVLKCLDCAKRASEEDHEPPVKYFSSVPYVLQMLAADDSGLDILRSMEIVGVGGAALPQDTGDELVEKGINLISRFGSAECGFLMSSHRNYSSDREWQYLRSNTGSQALSFEKHDEGLFELVIRPSWPHMAKHNRDDGSFATADLFAPHPSIKNAWRYHSRADSQLTLITGKKFDPAPLEASLATLPLLKDVLIFGNGRSYPGALLFRSDQAAELDDPRLVEEVWPAVEKLNAASSQHARLPKAMLRPMPADSPGLEKSSKGTILRAQAEKRYQKEIEAAYGDTSKLPDNGNDKLRVPIDSEEEMLGFVMQTIHQVAHSSKPIPVDTDLFSEGIDSVACMQIRAILQSALPSGSGLLPLNVVYDCGTIKALSTYLLNLSRGRVTQAEDEVQLMHDYVREYSNFSYHVIGTSKSDSNNSIPTTQANGHVVVLTGATGALGAHIVDQLRSNENVSRIICLVRAANPTAARERVAKSLLYRKKAPLDPSDSKVIVEVAKLGDRKLGLPHDRYDTIRDQVTTIVHAAWAVNFSTRLRSFVKDHISGVRNLLDLALQSSATKAPRFIFCSSTASVLGPATTSTILEQISHNPETASPLGYSRSKWVAEAICEQAHLSTRLNGRVSVVRIGQLCGDTANGVWNMTEAWPLMLSTVNSTRSLPALENESLAWLPVDVAARAVLHIAFNNVERDEKDVGVYHVLNEHHTPSWQDLLNRMKEITPRPFDVVSASKWVSQLENLQGPDATHPAKKLLGLWKNAYCSGQNNQSRQPGNSDIRFEMQRTKQVAPVMKDVRPIDKEHFEKMWRWIEKEMQEGNVKGEDVEKAPTTDLS